MQICDLIPIFAAVSSSGLLLLWCGVQCVWLVSPALIIHCSSVDPVWIEGNMPLIQEGFCWKSFLCFERVCSKLRPDLKWRSLEVWLDHRLVLITELFEQCALLLRLDGREMCFHASCNSVSLIWLESCGRLSLQILAWHGPENELVGWGGANHDAAELCLYSRSVNTLADITRDFFSFAQQRKPMMGDATYSTGIV